MYYSTFGRWFAWWLLYICWFVLHNEMVQATQSARLVDLGTNNYEVGDSVSTNEAKRLGCNPLSTGGSRVLAGY